MITATKEPNILSHFHPDNCYALLVNVKLSLTHPISWTIPYKVSWFSTSVTYIILWNRHTRGIRSTASYIPVAKNKDVKWHVLL